MLPKKIKFATYFIAITSVIGTPLTALAGSVYYIGNSLTDTINRNQLSNIVEEQLGEEAPWGRHIIFGAPLEWIWNHPNDGLSQNPYGYYETALNNYSWDFVSLQPFDRTITSDLDYTTRFINLAKAQNPDVQILIHGRWPRKSTTNPDATYSELWELDSSGGTKNVETRDYLNTLTQTLRDADLGIKAPLLVPAGEVMYELDQKMMAGEITGYNSIFDIYTDGIHLNSIGTYLTTMTFLSTMYHVDPATLDKSSITTVTPEIQGIFDRVIWDVVQREPLANRPTQGVPVPEPLTIFGVTTALSFGALFKRKLAQKK